jgi:pimeloyl-ACP methyl ester carboxylesterase
VTSEQRAYVKGIFDKAFASGRFSPNDFTTNKRFLVKKGMTESEADSALAIISDCLDCARIRGTKPDPAKFDNKLDRIKDVSFEPKVICSLHGIRTLGLWQKELADLVAVQRWQHRNARWSYGKFSSISFLRPDTREAKIDWLRETYSAEINDVQSGISEENLPSVVAHSYGTYILGYTLLRYDFVRFDKVILCGSILPRDFPWDVIIGRGQVQGVRNEYGVRDPWVKRVRGYVRDTGCSGALGFTCEHERLAQEDFDYDHGEYFGRDHMNDRWIPFLKESLPTIPRSNPTRPVRPPTHRPWGIYVGLASLVLLPALLCIECVTVGFSNRLGLGLAAVSVLATVVVNGWLFAHFSVAKL